MSFQSFISCMQSGGTGEKIFWLQFSNGGSRRQNQLESWCHKFFSKLYFSDSSIGVKVRNFSDQRPLFNLFRVGLIFSVAWRNVMLVLSTAFSNFWKRTNLYWDLFPLWIHVFHRTFSLIRVFGLLHVISRVSLGFWARIWAWGGGRLLSTVYSVFWKLSLFNIAA